MAAGSSCGDNTDFITASRVDYVEEELIHFAKHAESIFAIIAPPFLSHPDWALKHSRRVSKVDAMLREVR
jgi:hypothetical protein